MEIFIDSRIFEWKKEAREDLRKGLGRRFLRCLWNVKDAKK